MPDAVGFTVIILITIVVIIGCFFVYMTTPGKFRFFDIPAIYCHRGIHSETVPENSLSAFAECKRQNLAAELDVRRTADGKIVVFHDGDAMRMCSFPKKISEMTFEELSALRLGGTEEKIPLYSEVLEVLDGVPVYCEVKTDGLEIDEEFLKELCVLNDGYSGQVVIVSFNPYVLKWFREHRPEIIRGQLSKNFALDDVKGNDFAAFALSNLLTNFLAKPDFISFAFKEKTFGMSLCRLYGTRMVAWTVHSMDDVEDAAYAGYSSFVGEDFDMTEV